MNISLPLRYRPETFEELVGQKINSRFLSTLIQKGQIGRNIILHGAFGTSKTTSARIYARALNCLSPTESGSPCNICDHCKNFFAGVMADYREVDGATQGGKEKITELLEIVKSPPLIGKYRVITVDECVSYETLIKLADGSSQKIGQIVHNKIPVKVPSLNEKTGFIEEKKVVGWSKLLNGVWTIIEVRTLLGRTQLKVSPNHTCYTECGDKKAKNLTVQDKIPVLFPKVKKHHFNALAAIMVGYGSFSYTSEGEQRVVLNHSETQGDYLRFKKELYGYLVSSKKILSTSRSAFFPFNKIETFELNMYPKVKDFCSLMQNPKGCKKYSLGVLKHFNDLSLILWFLDSGSINSSGRFVCSVRSSFTINEITHFSIFIENTFGLHGTPSSYPIPEGNTVDNRISFSSKSVLTFLKGKLPDIPMARRKFGNDSSLFKNSIQFDNTYEEELHYVNPHNVEHNIKLIDPSYKYRYNIEVEDNHNYFLSQGVLMHNCQGLSKQAWDALLKIIEEPPPYLVFIFTTTEINKVREAIRSRCQTLEVKLLDSHTSKTHLKKICDLEQFSYEESALDLITHLSEGHPRDLLKNLEQVTYLGDVTLDNTKEIFNIGYIQYLIKIFRYIFKDNDPSNVIKNLKLWHDIPAQKINIMRELILFIQYRKIYKIDVTINPIFEFIPKPDIDNIWECFTTFTESRLLDPVECWNHLIQIFNAPIYSSIELDVFISNLWTFIHSYNFNVENFSKPVVDTNSSAKTKKIKNKKGRQFVGGYGPPKVEKKVQAESTIITSGVEIGQGKDNTLYPHNLLQHNFTIRRNLKIE